MRRAITGLKVRQEIGSLGDSEIVLYVKKLIGEEHQKQQLLWALVFMARAVVAGRRDLNLEPYGLVREHEQLQKQIAEVNGKQDEPTKFAQRFFGGAQHSALEHVRELFRICLPRY